MRSLVLLVALTLSGCSVPLHILLYNNGNAVIRVFTIDGLVSIAPLTQETFPIPYGGLVRVETGEQKLVYPVSVPDEYSETYEWPSRRAHLQFQSNHTIMIVGPRQTMPVSEATVQPEGFPLVPIPVAH